MKFDTEDWGFDYDADADVLYLGWPVRGYGEETPHGDVLRYDESDRFRGMTLIGIRRRLEELAEKEAA